MAITRTSIFRISPGEWMVEIEDDPVVVDFMPSDPDKPVGPAYVVDRVAFFLTQLRKADSIMPDLFDYELKNYSAVDVPSSVWALLGSQVGISRRCLVRECHSLATLDGAR